MNTFLRPFVLVLLCTLLSLPSIVLAENAVARSADDARNQVVAATMPAVYDLAITGVLYDSETGVVKTDTIRATGTAFGVTRDGLVFTKMHVVNPYHERIPGQLKDNAFHYANKERIEVICTLTAKNGKKYLAKLVAGDPDGKDDIALLQITGNEVLPFIVLAESLPGYDSVITIGSPLGHRFTVGEGIVSNPDALYGDQHYVQTTADISGGSSGGPLIRVRDHKAVGIVNSFYLSPFSGNASLGFATPSTALVQVLRDYERKTRATNE